MSTAGAMGRGRTRPEAGRGPLDKLAIVLVLLMVLLQGLYALFAFIDPIGFSRNRGTDLVEVADSDWVRIYASRTLFVALIVGYLLSARHFVVLKWAALLGLVMPLTDAVLAHRSGSDSTVVATHVATAAYLMCTALVLQRVAKDHASRPASGKRDR